MQSDSEYVSRINSADSVAYKPLSRIRILYNIVMGRPPKRWSDDFANDGREWLMNSLFVES